MKPSKAFTLIELLVVVSIIGLLAAIIAVNLKGSTDKARIATAKQFSSQVHHTLGADAVGIWRFEEGSGSTTNDASGYGNSGTLNDPTNMWQTESQCGLGFGGCLEFDGVGDHVQVPDDAILNIAEDLTIAVWIYINGPGANNTSSIIMKGEANFPGGAYRLYWTTSSESLTFRLTNATSNGPVAFSGGIIPERWYFVTATYDNVDMKLYIDGKLKHTRNNPNAIGSFSSLPLRIGNRSDATNQPFNGLIDEAAIYNTVLGASQIQKLYAEGLERHVVDNR